MALARLEELGRWLARGPAALGRREAAYTQAGNADEARAQLTAVEEQIEIRASRITDSKHRLRYLAQAGSQDRVPALATTLGMLPGALPMSQRPSMPVASPAPCRSLRWRRKRAA